MPQETNSLPLGYQLEEYRVESILGTGGFGITYKARDIHLEAWVAIKEYFPIEWSYRGRDGISVHANNLGQELIPDVKTSGYEWGLDRFLYEARVLASVQHPYVVRVRRYFRAGGTAYIVMDYEEGESLSALLRRESTLPEADLRGLLEEVLPALDAVHQKGYLHRDLKPSNLYIRARDGCLMLIDFGAARQSLGQHTKSITGLVTPGYSPPEQYVTRSDRYGPWTDIYALGAVLYRCITGKPPIEAPDRQMWDSMIPAVEAGAGRYGVDLLMVVDRALAMRPEDRFQTVAEVQEALANPNALDVHSRFTLVPKSTSTGDAKVSSLSQRQDPLEDLFDLATPPVSKPSRSSQSKVPGGTDSESSEKLSLPSLSIFDTTPPASSVVSSAANGLSSLPSSAVSASDLPSAQMASGSAPLLKPVMRRSTLAQSVRSRRSQEPTPELAVPETVEAVKLAPKRPRVILMALLALLGVGVILLYLGIQDKIAALRKEQLEAENHRAAAEEQLRREQDESRRAELAGQIEQADRAIAFKEWNKANEYLDRAESLQPGNVKVVELRNLLREEQRKLGSLEIQEEPVAGIKLVRLSQGCFEMGSAENQAERFFNESLHQVCSEGFWMGQDEVTNAQFRRFKPGHDSGSFRGVSLNSDQQPVVNVSWQEAVAFTEWLSQRTGKHFRLPTEVEWEYAAKANSTTIRFWGDNPADACRYANVADETAKRIWGAESIHPCDDGQAVSTTVGSYLPNVFKLHDMLGNVSEWTCSEYVEQDYVIEERRCSGQPPDRGRRVVRGGSWDDAPRLVRSADRNGREPLSRDNDLGFRVVRTE